MGSDLTFDDNLWAFIFAGEIVIILALVIPVDIV